MKVTSFQTSYIRTNSKTIELMFVIPYGLEMNSNLQFRNEKQNSNIACILVEFCISDGSVYALEITSRCLIFDE